MADKNDVREIAAELASLREMADKNDDLRMEQVWVQNLKGFIYGIFPPDKAWRTIFLEQLDATSDELTSLRDQLARVEAERDAFKAACASAGVCMTCVLRAPDTFGCSDCLNTGWSQGDPYAQIETLKIKLDQTRDLGMAYSADAKAAEAERDAALAVLLRIAEHPDTENGAFRAALARAFLTKQAKPDGERQ